MNLSETNIQSYSLCITCFIFNLTVLKVLICSLLLKLNQAQQSLKNHSLEHICGAVLFS